MIEIEITDAMLLTARHKAKALGSLKGSITKGAGNLVGLIGEEVAHQHFVNRGCRVHYLPTYDYDMIVDGLKIDVKTKSTSVVPLPHYSNSITDYNTTQLCDYYAFVRVKKDLTKAWWLGVCSKNVFFRDAKFMKKGEVDDDNKYVVKADCYNIPISALKEMM